MLEFYILVLYSFANLQLELSICFVMQCLYDLNKQDGCLDTPICLIKTCLASSNDSSNNTDVNIYLES